LYHNGKFYYANWWDASSPQASLRPTNYGFCAPIERAKPAIGFKMRTAGIATDYGFVRQNRNRWQDELALPYVNSITRFCVRDAHAKSGFWESGASRHSPKSLFVEFTLP
jgi:hypothetical protein